VNYAKRDESPIRILIQVSITKDELAHYFDSLSTSIINLRSRDKIKTHTLIILQHEHKDSYDAKQYHFNDAEVIQTDILSASHARNIGIEYAIHNNFDGIIFHDASIEYPINFLDIASLAFAEHQSSLVRANIQWKARRQNPGEEKPIKQLKLQKTTPNAIRHSYVWSYIFPVHNLTCIRFDTNLGPGRNTSYNCGEDVLFLLDYINHTKPLHLYTATNIAVRHHPRPSDMSKHLKYAKGQGALYRHLLKYYGKNFHIHMHFVLFCANSARLALLHGATGRKILYERLDGFWNCNITER
jgi:hypothetical protein